MKYVILLGDGMADYPIVELDGKTVIEAAHTPAMDYIAEEGTIGRIDTIPAGFTPGSDVANLSVLGYDPVKAHSGRGPLEAASMGITLASSDIAFRCNLVTLDNTDVGMSRMDDFTAGHISSEEARILIDYLNKELGSPRIAFHSGVGYRHLMVWSGTPLLLNTTPPHDIVGREIDPFFPRGKGADDIKELMVRSRKVLADHPVNKQRVAKGKKPATSIWLWGEGGAPHIAPLTEHYHIRGAVISAVDLLKGIGVYAGLEVLEVEGATGYIDTNYRGKAECALQYLEKGDFVFLHVEAPDEMGHEGDVRRKIQAIEYFDSDVVDTVLKGLRKLGEFRIVVLSDHPTPVSMKTHVADPSPFAVFSSRAEENLRQRCPFGETNANKSGITISPGYLLMEYFINGWGDFVKKRRSEN